MTPQDFVDPLEAALRALLDAVLHRRVAFLRRSEMHRLRELRLFAEILELERLQVVLKGLHQPPRRIDLAKLAFDDPERRAEPVRASRPDVHLLDECPVAPPLRDQLRIRRSEERRVGKEWRSRWLRYR